MYFKSILTGAVLLSSFALAGCVTTNPSAFSSNYSAVQDGGYAIPAVSKSKIPEKYRRQVVAYPTKENPGTIIVDTQNKYLYSVMGGGKATRYGIGVGRNGFRWAGNAYVGTKAAWPHWTPPAPMLRRQPQLRKLPGGVMKPGLNNPLGARALYLYRGGRDTLYRLHGTPEWQTIGTNVSSGCIRLINQDVIDLYNRTKVGAKVIVK